MGDGGHYCEFMDGLWITKGSSEANWCRCNFDVHGKWKRCPCCNYPDCDHVHEGSIKNLFSETDIKQLTQYYSSENNRKIAMKVKTKKNGKKEDNGKA
jgi:hypothetical protein